MSYIIRLFFGEKTDFAYAELCQTLVRFIRVCTETSDQTVAQCQGKLQKLLSITCYYGVSGAISIPQSFLRTFLKLCFNSVHFKKRRSMEQAFSKCQEHNTGHAVGALKSTLPFLHKFQSFLKPEPNSTESWPSTVSFH